MQKLVTRVARESAGRIAALTATSGAVSSSRGPAHARAPVQQPDIVAAPSSPYKDEWLITQVDAGNVLFRPEDIDEVADEVLQLVPRQLSRITSQSETESDGQEATSIIEANDLSGSLLRKSQAGAGDIQVLMRVASELLKKPGVQNEVMGVIMTDPDLLRMLSDKSSMDDYLHMWGVHSSGLLPPTVIEEVSDETPAGSDGDGGSPLDKLMAHLMTAFGNFGQGMQHVANWLKGIFQGPPAADSKPDAAPAAGPGRFFDAFNSNPLVKAAVVVGVMLVCVLLLRRPHLLAALTKRKAAAAAAAAAVGVTAAAKQ